MSSRQSSYIGARTMQITTGRCRDLQQHGAIFACQLFKTHMFLVFVFMGCFPTMVHLPLMFVTTVVVASYMID